MVKISTSIYGDDEEMVFGGILSYARSPYSRSLKGVDTAIVGVPFDLASSYRPGSRFAPAAIRKASAQLAWGPIWPWGFKPTEIIKVVDYGDLSFDYAKPVTIVKAIEKQISQILSDGTSTLVLGGDHYISYPVLKAYSEFYQDFYVLQFDAHPDLWESGGNNRLDHGIFMYNLIKKNIVNPKKLIQVGIRTFIEDGLGSNVLDMEWINQNGIEKVVSEIKSIVGNNPVYLTFDIDCLDPSCAPGTGTPVVGGLSSFQALSILRKLKGINFIGMDIVEVCPPYDIADITALAAATVSLEYLSLRAAHFQV